MDNQQKQQAVEQIKAAKHVLVTVSTNPTVDELAASIGLTLAINRMDKHATTVFSGIVPSTIEFLQPEKTIETTTDSLRDFIIALDKSKADKLRYKVEDDVVRIFITPYRTTITDKDLEFSQGDFNVDLVIALGVTKRQDLDKAITAHGRILHDATIVALTKGQVVSDLGSINWQDVQASSLCEMVANVVTTIQPEVIDGQMATSFLTGIIAETDRFKNEKTTPLALSLSSQLMTAGANQQLIAEKLEEPEPAPVIHREEMPVNGAEGSHQRSDGELEIDHSNSKIDKIHIDDDGNLNLAHDVDHEEQPISSELPEPSEPEPYQQEQQQSEYIEPDNNQNETNSPEDTPIDNPEESHQEESEQEESHQEGPQDVGRDLFDDLASENSENGDQPTLKQPNSEGMPTMQHGLVLQPPVHPDDLPKSDKPFDPQEAMQEIGVPQQIQSSVPQIPQVLQTPQPQLPQVELDQKTDDSSIISPTQQTGSGDSLADLEKSLGSTHLSSQVEQTPVFPAPPSELDEVRDSVIQAVASQPSAFPTPAEATGAHPISLDPPTVDNSSPGVQNDPNAPPPVPPPMTPQFYDEDGNNSSPF